MEPALNCDFRVVLRYRFAAAGALAPTLDGQAGMGIEGIRIPIADIPMPGVAAADIPGVGIPIGGMPIGGMPIGDVPKAPALAFHDGKLPHTGEFVLAPPTDVPRAERVIWFPKDGK